MLRLSLGGVQQHEFQGENEAGKAFCRGGGTVELHCAQKQSGWRAEAVGTKEWRLGRCRQCGGGRVVSVCGLSLVRQLKGVLGFL